MFNSPTALPAAFYGLDDTALEVLAEHYARLAQACRLRARNVREAKALTASASVTVAKAKLSTLIVARLLAEGETLPGALAHAAHLSGGLLIGTVALHWRDHTRATKDAIRAAKRAMKNRQGVPPRKRGPSPCRASNRQQSIKG